MIETKKIEYVAIYTRVSTVQQVEEGFSLDAQEDRLKNLAKANGYKIYKIYSDKGISGKDTIHRPAFREMMEDMAQKHFSKIIVMKLDRISRSVSDLENLIKELQKYNCGFESASEKIDTESSMGLMFIRLLGVFAQFERERISERIKDVFDDKVNKGLAITGMVPIGYKIGNNENGEKIVVKDETASALVIDMYDTYEKTSSLAKTCIYLNNKYPDLVYNNGFTHTDVKRIMSNTMYYGKFRDNENFCEPYLPYDRWKKINDIRKSKNIKATNRYVYIFSGLVYGACGHKLYGTTYNTLRKGKNIRWAYRCGDKLNCRGRVTELAIEKEILNMLPGAIDNRLKELDFEYNLKKDEDNSAYIKSLENEKARIINSYTKGWIDEKKAEIEINKITEELKKLKSPTTKKDYSKLKELKSIDFSTIYNSLSRENKQLLFREIIDKIIVDIDKYKKKEDNFIKLELL